MGKYYKNAYLNNKDYYMEVVVCEACGGTYKRSNRSNHEKTKKHNFSKQEKLIEHLRNALKI